MTPAIVSIEGDPRVGRSPSIERTPFRIHDAVVGSRSMSVEDLESRRFELNIRLSLLKPVLAQSRPQNCFFGVFQKIRTFRSNNRAHNKMYLKNYDGHRWDSIFLWKLCVSSGVGFGDRYLYNESYTLCDTPVW